MTIVRLPAHRILYVLGQSELSSTHTPINTKSKLDELPVIPAGAVVRRAISPEYDPSVLNTLVHHNTRGGNLVPLHGVDANSRDAFVAQCAEELTLGVQPLLILERVWSAILNKALSMHDSKNELIVFVMRRFTHHHIDIDIGSRTPRCVDEVVE